MKSVEFGILEFGYINPPELYAHEVINQLFQEISLYESMGYKRLWLSEHFSPEFAWFYPEMLLPLLAGYSEKIRVGIAGILLSYHSPLLVAQNFKILSAVYADRIDLGIARAGIPDNVNKYLIANEEKERLIGNWEQKITELLFFLRNDEPKNQVLENMVVPPHGTILPEQWILGASPSSVNLAIQHRCNLCVSFMHPGSDFKRDKDLMKTFKENFSDINNQKPITAVLLPCALVEDNDARKKIFDESYANSTQTNLFGTKNYIQDKLALLTATFDCDEVILYTPYWERQKRIETYKSIIED
jgi:alkanesulfonate monooxygenase SsuD/methylene tetrahydromethanopterin reductase-like flavin-dependent oxidoreductase (luciferase family)